MTANWTAVCCDQVLNVLFFVVGGALSAVTPKHQFCWNGLGEMNGCVPTALFIGRILTGFGEHACCAHMVECFNSHLFGPSAVETMDMLAKWICFL